MATGPFVGQRLTSLPCDVEVGPSPTQKVSFSTVCPLAQFGVTAPERILRCKTRRPVPGQSAVTLRIRQGFISVVSGTGARRAAAYTGFVLPVDTHAQLYVYIPTDRTGSASPAGIFIKKG